MPNTQPGGSACGCLSCAMGTHPCNIYTRSGEKFEALIPVRNPMSSLRFCCSLCLLFENPLRLKWPHAVKKNRKGRALARAVGLGVLERERWRERRERDGQQLVANAPPERLGVHAESGLAGADC